MSSPYKTVTKQRNVTASNSNNVKRRPEGILICTNGTRCELINQVSKRLEWHRANENELWNISWTDLSSDISLCRKMKRFQRINHFPGMQELCRKDLLARNLKNMQKKYPELYQFFPKTWTFPADLAAAQNYLNKHTNCFFILKPDSGARGNGIFIVNTLKDLNPYQRMIGQLYIERPLLVDGYKFDLRVYVLITSIDPLRVYVYNEGLMRLATKRYKKPNSKNIDDRYMHLTNYSINKHNFTYSKEEDGGNKRTFKIFNNKMTEMGCDVTRLWSSIDDIIIKTVISAWPILRHEYRASFPFHDVIPACFEVLGFDVIIAHNLVPYLLEVNNSPSLNVDSSTDRRVKHNLIKDTFRLLKVSSSDRPHVLREDKVRVFDRLSRNIKFCASKQNEFNIKTLYGNESAMNDQWIENVKWEESNLGNYRQIMPCSDVNKYMKLIVDVSGPSLYLDTFSSNIRKVIANDKHFQYTNTYQRVRKRNVLQRHIPVITTKKLIKINNNFLNEKINRYEEFKREMLFAQREKAVMLSGIASIIYESFDKNNLLNESDRIKYGNFVRENSDFIKSK